MKYLTACGMYNSTWDVTALALALWPLPPLRSLRRAALVAHQLLLQCIRHLSGMRQSVQQQLQ